MGIKLNGKYSFSTVSKNEVFPPENEQIDSKEDIKDKKCYDIFTINKEKIIEEYCRQDGSCNLYRSIDDENLEVLYEEEHTKNSNEIEICIYTPYRVYVGTIEDRKVKRLSYINAVDFKFIFEKLPEFELLQNIYAHICSIYLISDFNIVCELEDSIALEEFKKAYVKYQMTTNLIPASQILEKIKEYIDKGKTNQEDLEDKYIYLQNFQEICYDSIERLAPVVENLEKANVSEISTQIGKNLSNIQKLIDLYLSNELDHENIVEKTDEGEQK